MGGESALNLVMKGFSFNAEMLMWADMSKFLLACMDGGKDFLGPLYYLMPTYMVGMQSDIKVKIKPELIAEALETPLGKFGKLSAYDYLAAQTPFDSLSLEDMAKSEVSMNPLGSLCMELDIEPEKTSVKQLLEAQIAQINEFCGKLEARTKKDHEDEDQYQKALEYKLDSRRGRQALDPGAFIFFAMMFLGDEISFEGEAFNIGLMGFLKSKGLKNFIQIAVH